MSRRMRHIMVVFGTRPEAIKMMPLVKALAETPEIHVDVLTTGQHRDMVTGILNAFEVRPDYDLAIMQEGQDLTDITTRTLQGMRAVLGQQEHRPDMVLVHGDTTTAMSAALASFYAQIAVGHVEAGLRTGDIRSPYPEEMNRQVIGRIATWHFAPTERAKANLLHEGVAEKNIVVTGNTGIDALMYTAGKIGKDKALAEELTSRIKAQGYDLDRARQRKIVVVTAHRRENLDRMPDIGKALKELAVRYAGQVDFVYPIHPNPKVRNGIKAGVGHVMPENLYLIAPLEYMEFVALMSKAHLIVTDSGGIQEEAPSLGKPVVVMRDSTERAEAVEAGTVRLVTPRCETIVETVGTLLDDKNAYEAMRKAVNPYGDGRAAGRIAEVLKNL